MSLLNTLFNNESIKKQLFSKLAKQAKENGIKKLLITINEDGTFESEVITENTILTDVKTNEFLVNFWNRYKNKTGVNWQDKINNHPIDEIKNLDNNKKH